MKRRWFQLHLLTCVILVFVAGGILRINLLPRTTPPPRREDFTSSTEYSSRLFQSMLEGARFGYPFVYCKAYPTVRSQSVKDGILQPLGTVQPPAEWYWFALIGNVAAAVFVLVALASAFEYLVYRRLERALSSSG